MPSRWRIQPSVRHRFWKTSVRLLALTRGNQATVFPNTDWKFYVLYWHGCCKIQLSYPWKDDFLQRRLLMTSFGHLWSLIHVWNTSWCWNTIRFWKNPIFKTTFLIKASTFKAGIYSFYAEMNSNNYIYADTIAFCETFTPKSNFTGQSLLLCTNISNVLTLYIKRNEIWIWIASLPLYFSLRAERYKKIVAMSKFLHNSL